MSGKVKDLYIIGCGGFSKQVIELVEELNKREKQFHLIGLVDDNPSNFDSSVLGYRVLGDTDYLLERSLADNICAVIAIGDGCVRQKLSEALPNLEWVNLIHPKAIISRHTTLGRGNIICAGVIINPDCRLGNHCNINIGTTLGHDVELNDFSTIMPGSRLSGNVTIGRKTTIGTGSVVLQNLHVGEGSILGAGSVATKSIPAHCVYIGVPARKMQD